MIWGSGKRRRRRRRGKGRRGFVGRRESGGIDITFRNGR
jgi:hypothetical protein